MADTRTIMNRSSKRIKWSQQMSVDCIDCKREALVMISSENPPFNENGKKGCIKVEKELWDERGYLSLGLTSQNLRDMAARLEKTTNKNGVNENSNAIYLKPDVTSRENLNLENLKPDMIK